MDVQKSHPESESKQLPTETEPSSTVTTSCGRRKSDNGSFVTNLRDRYHELINTPMEDHKACFKTTIDKTIDKMMAIFPPRKSSPKEGETPMPAQTAVEN